MVERPRMLLLAGTPPGSGNVGEIILRDLVLHYGPQHADCVAVVGPRYRHHADSQLMAMKLDLHRTRHVTASRHGDGYFPALISDLRFPLEFRTMASSLVTAIVNGARASGVQLVFAVMNNAMMMTLAHRVAKHLGVPLVALVWDPPNYLLRQSRFARNSRRWLLHEFERTLAHCRRVGVVSESMREAYSQYTSVPILILRHGRPAFCGPDSNLRSHPDGLSWTIGFAGSMYSDCAWTALLDALDTVGWRVADRPVRLRMLTASAKLERSSRAWIEYLGFREDGEIDALLAECDLNYLPQPFKVHLRELCRYAFPSKLAAYLAAGKPVFVHCPKNSALGDYFSLNPFGTICRSLEPEVIISALELALTDADGYRTACIQAANLAQTQFDGTVFRAAIDELLG